MNREVSVWGILAIVLLMMGITACTCHEQRKPKPVNPIVGTWVMTWDVGQKTPAEGTVTFKEDGTVVSNWYEVEWNGYYDYSKNVLMVCEHPLAYEKVMLWMVEMDKNWSGVGRSSGRVLHIHLRKDN